MSDDDFENLDLNALPVADDITISPDLVLHVERSFVIEGGSLNLVADFGACSFTRILPNTTASLIPGNST